MRRDIGNELVVALLAAVSLLFAGLFALLLASSTQNPPAPASPTGAPAEQSATDVATASPTPPATAVLSSITPRAPATDLASPSPTALTTNTVGASVTSAASATADTAITLESSATALATSSVTATSTPATAASATLETVGATLTVTTAAPPISPTIGVEPPSRTPLAAVSATATGTETPRPVGDVPTVRPSETLSDAPTRTPAPATPSEDDAPTATPLTAPTLLPAISATYTATVGLTTEGAQATLTDTPLSIETATENATQAVRPGARNTPTTSPAPTLTKMTASETARPASPTLAAELTTPEDQPTDLAIAEPGNTPTLVTTGDVTASATETALREVTATAHFSVSTGAPTATDSEIALFTMTAAVTAPSADTLTAIPTATSVATSEASPVRLTPISTASATVEATATQEISAPTDLPTELLRDRQTFTPAPALISDVVEATLTSPSASATAVELTLTPASLATEEPGPEPSPRSTNLLPAETALLETVIPGATKTRAAAEPKPTPETELPESEPTLAEEPTIATDTATGTPTQISTAIERIRSLDDFLLQLYRRTVGRPSRPPTVSVQTQAPEATTTTTAIHPATATRSETSIVTVTATEIVDPVKTTAPATIAPVTATQAAESITPTLTRTTIPLTSRVADVYGTQEPTPTSVSPTDEATLPTETPEIAQTDAPETAIAVDRLTSTMESTLVLTATPDTRATEVGATDEPAETAISRAVDETPTSIPRAAPTQISTPIKRIRSLDDFLLQLSRRTVGRPSRPPAVSVQTQAPEATTTTALQPATATRSETSVATVKATEIVDPVKTTAPAVPPVDTIRATATIAPATTTQAAESITLTLTRTTISLTRRVADVDVTRGPLATAFSPTDKATLSVETPEIAQTGAPVTTTGIAMDTLTAMPTARATEMDATDEPAEATISRAVDGIVQTEAPVTTTAIAVDMLTSTMESTLADATTATTRAIEVDATDEPAETAISRAVDETPTSTPRAVPTQISTPIKRVRSLDDFLLQLYRRTVGRPSRPPTVSVQTQAPEPTTTTALQPATATRSETSVATVKATEIVDPVKTTAPAAPPVDTIRATATIAPATTTQAAESITPTLTRTTIPLTRRVADVDVTRGPLATAFSPTDEATLPTETPEIAQTAAPVTTTGIAMDTLTAMPTARATEMDATDEPAEATISRAVDGIVQTEAPVTTTAIAVDMLTSTMESTLADATTATTRAIEVDATDEPAETAISRAVDETPTSTPRAVPTQISTPIKRVRSLDDFLLQLYRRTVGRPSRPPTVSVQTQAPEPTTTTTLQPATATRSETSVVTVKATEIVDPVETTAPATIAPATATQAAESITPTLTRTTISLTRRVADVDVTHGPLATAFSPTDKATLSVETPEIAQTGAPETAIAVDTLTETVESTLADAAAPAATETGVLATQDLTAATTGLPTTTAMPSTASAESATPADEPATSAATFALPTLAPEVTHERLTATAEPFTPSAVIIATDASPLPVTATAMPSPTARPSATDAPTALPAVLAYLIATPTAYDSRTPDLEPACKVRQDWAPYEVQFGDTLLALALAADTDLITLREANCLSPISGILAGDTIAVPLTADLPLTVPEPVFPPATQEYRPSGCASADAQIQSPLPGAELSGIFAVAGQATVPEGGSYEISVMPAWSDAFHKLLEIDISVNDNVIGLVNSEIFGPGLQRLRLALVDKDGTRLEDSVCEVPVVFLAP